MLSAFDARERSSVGAGPSAPRSRQVLVRRIGCGSAEALQVHSGTTVAELRRHLQCGSSNITLVRGFEQSLCSK